MGLPDAIRHPIEVFHDSGAAAGAGEPPLTRVLRLADRCANGLLLAGADNAPISPLTGMRELGRIDQL